MDVTDAEQKKEKIMNEDSLRDLWNNIKHTNILILGVPEGGEREKGAENICEDTIAENFPNLWKETDFQVQEAQRVPNRINPKRSTPRHIVIRMTKIKHKERFLKAAREKQQVTYRFWAIMNKTAVTPFLERCFNFSYLNSSEWNCWVIG